MNHYSKREEEKPMFVKVLHWLAALSLMAGMLLLFWVPMHAQERSNTYYAAQFDGKDVGTKVTNAQKSCSPNTSLPCIIVFDAILASWPQGTLPGRCSNCIWVDYTSTSGEKITPQVLSVTNISMVEGSAPSGLAGSDILFPDSATHRLKMINNNGSADSVIGAATTDTLTNKTFTDPVINGNPTGTGIPTVAMVKGNNAGNYSTSSTSFVAVDGVNLAHTVVTLPVGWKLTVVAAGSVQISTGLATVDVAIFDGLSAVQTVVIDLTSVGRWTPWTIAWVINGDGGQHPITLKYLTTNAADAANMLNNGGAIPTMVLTVTPSN